MFRIMLTIVLAVGCSTLDPLEESPFGDDDKCEEVENDTSLEFSDFDAPRFEVDDESDEVEATTLEVAFTTAWSAAVPFEVTPGQKDVNFGAWTFWSETGDDIVVEDITVMDYVDVNGDDVFMPFEEEGVSAQDYLENCRLIEVVSRDVVMGPMDPGAFGVLYFTDDFTVGGEYSTALNLVCDIQVEAEELDYASFAWDIQVLDMRSTADHHWFASHNVDYVDGEPGACEVTLAAYVDNRSESCEFDYATTGAGTITINNEVVATLSSASPSGASVPGYEEVMRFNLTSLHSGCDDLIIGFMPMWVNATDNAGSGWDDDIGSVDVYNLSTDPSVVAMSGDLDGAWVGTSGELVVPAGETITVSVWLDSTGASTTLDDSLQVELGGRLHLSGVEYPVYDTSFQLAGGTLVF